MLENLNNNLDENNKNQESELMKEAAETNSGSSKEIIETKFTEEIPLIIYEKKEDCANSGGRYYLNSFEDNNKFVQPEEKQTYRYRWTLSDEEDRLSAKKIKKAKKSLGLKIFAGAMSAMFAFSALTSGYLLLERVSGSTYNASSKNNFENLAIAIPSDDANNAEELTVSQVIAKVKPSVVCIQTEVEVTSMNFWGRGGGSYTQTGVGTGFILTEDGYIATNYHVIEDAKTITVMLDNGKSYPATLIGGDSTADLAIVKINAKNLPVAKLGNSDATIEGEFVVAIGSPGGAEFAGSSTFGIISAVNRDVEVSQGKKMNLVQTDAAINPGNSGGPLVNMKGQVIGINTLKLASTISASYEGMGFAIPITSAVAKFNDIIANPSSFSVKAQESDNEYVAGSYNANDTSSVSFGINGGTVSKEMADFYDVPQGVVISGVKPDGACGKAGIKTDDIITALDGKTVTTMDELVELKNNYKPGDKAAVKVFRDGETLDITITFDAK